MENNFDNSEEEKDFADDLVYIDGTKAGNKNNVNIDALENKEGKDNLIYSTPPVPLFNDNASTPPVPILNVDSNGSVEATTKPTLKRDHDSFEPLDANGMSNESFENPNDPKKRKISKSCLKKDKEADKHVVISTDVIVYNYHDDTSGEDSGKDSDTEEMDNKTNEETEDETDEETGEETEGTGEGTADDTEEGEEKEEKEEEEETTTVVLDDEAKEKEAKEDEPVMELTQANPNNVSIELIEQDPVQDPVQNAVQDPVQNPVQVPEDPIDYTQVEASQAA